MSLIHATLADAVAKPRPRMEKGGVGKWGPVPMPPLGATVSLEERKQRADGILGHRWAAVLAE